MSDLDSWTGLRAEIWTGFSNDALVDDDHLQPFTPVYTWNWKTGLSLAVTHVSQIRKQCHYHLICLKSARCNSWLNHETVEIAVSHSVYGLQYNWWLVQEVCKPMYN